MREAELRKNGCQEDWEVAKETQEEIERKKNSLGNFKRHIHY
jgi:hypothetical protein